MRHIENLLRWWWDQYFLRAFVFGTLGFFIVLNSGRWFGWALVAYAGVLALLSGWQSASKRNN